MTSEIRANKQTNRAGLGTVTYTDTGIIVSGIVTCTELSGLTALNIAGVGTASTLDINGDIDVDGHTNLDNVSVSGVSTFSAGINVPDNQRINVGNGNDLYLKHDGTNSELHNNVGSLTIDSGIHLNITNVHGEDMAKFLANGAVELYHNNIKRLETSSVGAVSYTHLTLPTICSV